MPNKFIFAPTYFSTIISIRSMKTKIMLLVSALSRQGFLFADKRIELSNHNLIRDMENIIRLEEILSI